MPIPAARVKLELNETNVIRLVDLLDYGADHPKQSYVLQRQLGLPEQQTSESVRALVEYAIKEHSWAIGSGPKGYYLIANEAELGSVVASLKRRAAGCLSRAASLEDAWAVRNP